MAVPRIDNRDNKMAIDFSLKISRLLDQPVSHPLLPPQDHTLDKHTYKFEPPQT